MGCITSSVSSLRLLKVRERKMGRQTGRERDRERERERAVVARERKREEKITG